MMLYLLNIQSYQASIRPSQARFKEIERTEIRFWGPVRRWYDSYCMNMQAFIRIELGPNSSGSIRRRRANSLDSKALKSIFLNRVKYESISISHTVLTIKIWWPGSPKSKMRQVLLIVCNLYLFGINQMGKWQWPFCSCLIFLFE